MTTIDAMLFSVSVTEILMSYGSSVRGWTLEPGTPTDSTGTQEHKKNHLDEVQAGFWHYNSSRRTYVLFKCFAVLYCMAYDLVK